jgi:hypothetical protein
MGILDVEHNRLRQQEIELKALIALAQFGKIKIGEERKLKALRRLEEIAFPEDLAKKINNQQQFGLE